MSLKRIKSEVALEEVISQFTEVSGQYPYLKAICPFHNDSKPSLNIFKNGRWRCFVCNIGGDVIDFVQKVNNSSTREAADWLEKEFSVKKDHQPKVYSDDELKKKANIAKKRLNKLDNYLWTRYRQLCKQEELTEEEWGWLASTERYRTNIEQDERTGLAELDYLSRLPIKQAIEELKQIPRPSWYTLSVSPMAKEASAWFKTNILDQQIKKIKSDPRLYIIASTEAKEKDPIQLAIKLNADDDLLKRVANRYANK